MLQVLANLITNAIKFTARGGAITVRGERAGDDFRLSVDDTGCGIPGNVLDAVFERFWQVGTNDRRGLGLGLYISKCIVEAHGGRIWADSRLGEGSVFHVTIPAAAHASNTAQ
jgi:signal transduction histidine kinase